MEMMKSGLSYWFFRNQETSVPYLIFAALPELNCEVNHELIRITFAQRGLFLTKYNKDYLVVVVCWSCE